MMNSPRIGDRIRLTAMLDDPDPIKPGMIGVVTKATRHGEGREKWFQIDLDWANGRTLMLVSPLDRFEPANAN